VFPYCLSQPSLPVRFVQGHALVSKAAMLPLKQGCDNVPPSREKSAVSPGTAQSGRRIWRKYRAVCAYRNVPPDS